ncbi:MAG: hypothetical protein HFI82_08375 [Eubacterium sp.]|jgi:signal transduction histidine kinase|nr:hypothetical protein [Eubacterium sp.]
MENVTKFDYSKKISKSRNYGNINEAIDLALEAKKKYPEENIFEKFLGDLYFQINNYEAAGNAYINFLLKIDSHVEYVKHFAQFMKRYAQVVTDISKYLLQVQKILDIKIQNQNTIAAICEIISHYIFLPELNLFEDDKKFYEAMLYLHKIENTYKIYILFYKILYIRHTMINRKIDKSVISSMEKKERYKEALVLIVEALKYDQDKVTVRTLFRICRKLDDYSEAEKYIEKHPDIKSQGEFNILYELVFYYSKIGNIDDRNNALKKIEICGRNSIPIMRTLYNFYLQFGMLNKAVEIKSIIAKKQKRKKKTYNEDRNQQENDAAEALLRTIQEMFTELEHSRKLISMSELLKGFSHELGQPITNIRYGIQLFQMKMEKGINTNEELKILLENILSQTYRIKKLLVRFSPITSEKNPDIIFSVTKEIEGVFGEFSSRFSKENIEWKVESDLDFTLFGDNIKFDQIFYNLIGNSIYAINEKGEKGYILVRISENEMEYVITFEDNGIGIKPEYIGKVFEPFFTTKDCSNDENGGGEGLGLYIIWNIVRMFDGIIKVDKEYKNGARFIINILKKEKERDKYE